MMRYGLLGEKLGHSYSPFIYRELGIDDYRLFEVAPDKVEPFLRGGNLAGLNVTIPYKKGAPLRQPGGYRATAGEREPPGLRRPGKDTR